MALSPLHRIWRGLPQGPRRRALSAVAGLLAPRPDAVPASPAWGVIVAGELDRDSGLGEAARATVAGLEALGVAALGITASGVAISGGLGSGVMASGGATSGVTAAPGRASGEAASGMATPGGSASGVTAWGNRASAGPALPDGAASGIGTSDEPSSRATAWRDRASGGPALPDGAPLVVHATAPTLALDLLRLGRRAVRGRRVVAVLPWELPVVPASWRTALSLVHEAWTPSRFSAAALRAVAPGGMPVRVVPHPVACRPPRPAALDRAALGLPEGAVVTLVAFSLASSFARKNPLAAIAAHRAAFGDRADRMLLLRVGAPGPYGAELEALRAAARGVSNVRIDTVTRPRDEAHAIMAASDIVLSLHRSEGFGLVPAEAMLLGKPVVATAWSGTEDFLDDRWAIRVPYRLVPAVDPRGVFTAPGAEWAEADGEAAAAALRLLADDEDERRRLGEAARAAGAERFGPGPMADAIRAWGGRVLPA